MSEENRNDENAIVRAETLPPVVSATAALQARIERVYTDTQLDALFMKKAEIMAKSSMLPPMYRGDVYACFALQQLAFVWQTNPMLLAPGLYKVKPDSPLSLDGKTVKSIFGRYAPVKDHYVADEYFGDWSKIIGKFKVIESKKATDEYGRPKTYRVPAWNPEDEEGLGIRLKAELLNGKPITYELLLKQCLTRNSTLWAEDPMLQIWYRAMARFSRKYFPEILNGMYIKEEIEDEGVIDVTPDESKPVPVGKTKAERLKSKLIPAKAAEDAGAGDNANKPDRPNKPDRQNAGAEGAARSSSAKAAEDKADGNAGKDAQDEWDNSREDLKKFLEGYLESSHAPVTIELIERFLREDKHVKQNLNDKDFPANWTEYILKHPYALVKYVFDWSEKQGAQTDENGQLL